MWLVLSCCTSLLTFTSFPYIPASIIYGQSLIHPGRRLPTARTATGRLPVGTPGQLLGISSHSHIRIVPRATGDTAENSDFYDRDVPTFRSPSLQFPPTPGRDSRRGSTQSDASASGTSFADMARRFNQSDNEATKPPPSGSVPLPGYIQLKPGRNRQGNKTWRTPEPNNMAMGGCLGGDFDADRSSSPMDYSDLHAASEPLHPSPTQRMPPKGSTFDLPTIQNTPTSAEASQSAESTSPQYDNQSVLPGGGSEDVSPTDTRFNVDVIQDYTRVFGRLPDLIHLHEQTGDFDGQIVFIGHPNRDVSAHQWSSASFQWVSIGNWSQTRNMIEGSLATDRIARSNMNHRSIEYFKAVSQQRERLIQHFGRGKEVKSAIEARSTLTGAEEVAPQSITSRSPTATFTSRANGPPAPIPANSRAVTREPLDDPFVSPDKPQQPVIPMSLEFGGVGSGGAGAMDFSYQFPAQSTPDAGTFSSQPAHMDLRKMYTQREHDRLGSMRGGDLPREHETSINLREVVVGEEAASSFSTPAARPHPSRFQGPMSPEDIHNRLQLKTQLSELTSQVRRLSLPPERRIAVPDVPMMSSNIRTLFPPGLTVANPHRGIASKLNAKAAPYTRVPAAVQLSEETESECTANNAQPGPKLHFSDPDGVRRSHMHEIANGLDQQAPTRQNFHGPFFADSMPTTYNLTANLAVPVSAEEKLVNWFRDGQRPARQQEYAKTLMATARADNHIRSFGAIGETSSKTLDKTMYDNTPLFTRVYENLLQYAEESRAGVSSDHFTCAWKSAPLHLRDLTVDGNNSFFNDTTITSPRVERAPLRPVAASPSIPRGSVAKKPTMAAPWGQSVKPAYSGWGASGW